MNFTVYVVDGWDERTDTAFCEVFLLREDANEREAGIRRHYASRAGGKFFAVGVFARKVK